MIVVHEIRWNRTFFEIRFSSDELERLYLYRVKDKLFIPLESCDDQGNLHVARINVTTAADRGVLPRGQWIICTKIDDSLLKDPNTLLSQMPHLRARMERDIQRNYAQIDFSENPELLDKYVDEIGLGFVAEHPYDTHGIRYDESILDNIINYSIIYRYAKKTYAYAISLIAKENSEGDVFLALEPEFFRRYSNPKIREGSKTFALKRVMRAIYSGICMVSKPFRNGKRILFLKENATEPTENMAALQQRMRERHVEDHFDVACQYRNVFSGRQSPLGWFKDMLLIARSDYIFVDDYIPIFNFIAPVEGTKLIQIWHAGVGFKSVGYARFGAVGSPDPYASCHRKYTYALVGNAGLRDIYSEVFGIEKDALLATGMPRLDHFLDKKVIESARKNLYERYPQLKTGRVILFAPTFRGAGQRTAYYPYNKIDMEALHEMCARTNSFFIFEMHHFIQRPPVISEEFSDRILDLSCENLNQLFHISDVLVTDYSSCFYDYLLLKKPVVFFTPDREVYTATRGVQRPIKEMAPGIVCDTFESFLSVLENNEYEFFTPDPSTIDRAQEGTMLASDRVIDTVLYGRDVPGVRLCPSATVAKASAGSANLAQ